MKSIKDKILFQVEDKAWRHHLNHTNPNYLRLLRYIRARISDNLTSDYADIVWVSLVEEMEHEKS
jgi:hypothetical protein